VHADDLLVDDGDDGQRVEALCEDLPEFDGVPALAFINC